MKKLISILLMAGLLLTGSIAYAEDNGVEANRRINAVRSLANEYKEQLDTIRENRRITGDLTRKAMEIYRETKQKVRRLLNSRDELSQAQIEAIKEAIDRLVADKKLLVETRGEILKDSIDLRAARKNRDSEAYKEALDGIIATQNERIKILNKVIEDLKAIEII